MQIIIVRDKISRSKLEELAREFYIEMVKGVVDVDQEILAMGGEWHMDANRVLIDSGSLQGDVWGFNYYLDGRIEYISLINIRPAQNNKTLEIEDARLREKMRAIIERRIE